MINFNNLNLIIHRSLSMRGSSIHGSLHNSIVSAEQILYYVILIIYTDSNREG